MSSHALPAALLGIAIGAAIGVGGYTFVYARGGSYLTDDPAACANCHVMQDYYDAWLKSSHRSAAACNDCHTPHGFLGKYYVKTTNGFWHSFAFTTQRFHEPLQIKPHNRAVTEATCRECHRAIVVALEGPHGQAGRMDCIRCHVDVGHLR